MCCGKCGSDKGAFHWGHCLHWCGKIFWVAALVALVLAWVATSRGLVWGLDETHWYWDALVLGVLALGLKMGSCGSGRGDACGGGGECREEDGKKCAACGEAACKCQ